MIDRENVIKELTNLPTTIYSGFYQLRITHDLRDKVIDLLKEQEMEEQETNQMKSSVKQEDVCEIMNKINDALEGTGYQATAYDNTGIWLNVIIEG